MVKIQKRSCYAKLVFANEAIGCSQSKTHQQNANDFLLRHTANCGTLLWAFYYQKKTISLLNFNT